MSDNAISPAKAQQILDLMERAGTVEMLNFPERKRNLYGAPPNHALVGVKYDDVAMQPKSKSIWSRFMGGGAKAGFADGSFVSAMQRAGISIQSLIDQGVLYTHLYGHQEEADFASDASHYLADAQEMHESGVSLHPVYAAHRMESEVPSEQIEALYKVTGMKGAQALEMLVAADITASLYIDKTELEELAAQYRAGGKEK